MKITRNKYIRSFLIIVVFLQITIFFINGDNSGLNTKKSNTKWLFKNIPDHRTFYMGLTPFPYDFTLIAVENTYKTVIKNSDLMVQHFDNGVPWEEASKNIDYQKNVISNINFRIKHLDKKKKLYLALTPISTKRDKLAGYWGKKENMKRRRKWRNKKFNDPDTIKAYTNYCRYMITRFKPNYFAYGIEVNILADLNPSAFNDFVKMAEVVYNTLKTEFPNLPIFLTFSINEFNRKIKYQETAIKRLLPFTDFIAVSTYPYTMYPDPDDIPKNWFSKIANLSPQKPFAVAETGFTAENLHLKKYNLIITGNETRQAKYLNFLLNSANKLNAVFLVWFVSRDYDAGWEKLKKLGVDEFSSLWKDTGLISGDGRERPSFQIWKAWLNIPLNRIAE